MITEKQKKIHEKYRKIDENGLVHCNECPLVIDMELHQCKANSHYDKHTRKWEWNEK